MKRLLIFILLFGYFGNAYAFEIERNEYDFDDFYHATEFVCNWEKSGYITKDGISGGLDSKFKYSSRIFNINYEICGNNCIGEGIGEIEDSYNAIKSRSPKANIKRVIFPSGINISYGSNNIILHAEKNSFGYYATKSAHFNAIQAYRGMSEDGKKKHKQSFAYVLPHIQGFEGKIKVKRALFFDY